MTPPDSLTSKVTPLQKSNKSARKNKPAKPYPDYPLFAHATNRWAKKIRGRFHYFGPWDDPDGALKKYLDERDYLHAGLPVPVASDAVTFKVLCNRFLNAKRKLQENGELSPRSFRDYYSTCERIIEHFGRLRLVDSVGPNDFEQLREVLSRTRGPVALGNEVIRVRTVFKFGFDTELLKSPVRYGQSFNKPSKTVLRRSRNASRAENGKRMFEPDELRKIIDAAGQPLRAMTLLGINCGFGQSDISSLPQSALRLDEGWVEYPRPKTGVERRCPLWPETVAALKEAMLTRPDPKDAADGKLAFLTKYGHRWVRTNPKGTGTPSDALGKVFAKLLEKLGIKRPSLSFYGLRYTFETIGGNSLDQVAVDSIMGHTSEEMAAHYREEVGDDRLLNVCQTIHRWLFQVEAEKVG